MNVCGRFAPTPSGRMHLGNVFCAMLAWLSVRSFDGTMLLRIEDLDLSRCKNEYTDTLIDDMLWLGFDWDIGGKKPEYIQSRRNEIYDNYVNILSQKGLTYPCFCTRDELHSPNAPHATDGTYIYNGTCRNLSPAQRALKGDKYSLRLCVDDIDISFVDGNLGIYSENLSRDCGDFIIRRSDGVYAYQLAVVVDDGLMGVNQVVRGVDLLPSTARQMYLFKLLGFPVPNYYHVPLLLSEDGRRLSKRDRDLDIGIIRNSGIYPEKVIGFLAYLSGLTDKYEPCKLSELVEIFDWSKVKKDNIYVKSNIDL